MADKPTKKVFDVAKPGSAKPDATSRPLIINHRNMVQDPMVADKTATAPELEASKSDKPSEKEKPIKNVGITIQPPESLQKTAKPEPQPEDSAAANGGESPADTEGPVSAEQEPSTGPAAAEEETAQETPEPPEEKPAEGAPEPAEPAEQAEEPTSQKDASKDAAKAAEQTSAEDAELRQLIESRQYYVPIGEAKRKRRTGAVVLVLLVLMAAGLVVAVDAEVIDVPIALPFDVIKM